MTSLPLLAGRTVQPRELKIQDTCAISHVLYFVNYTQVLNKKLATIDLRRSFLMYFHVITSILRALVTCVWIFVISPLPT